MAVLRDIAASYFVLIHLSCRADFADAFEKNPTTSGSGVSCNERKLDTHLAHIGTVHII